MASSQYPPPSYQISIENQGADQPLYTDQKHKPEQPYHQYQHQQQPQHPYPPIDVNVSPIININNNIPIYGQQYALNVTNFYILNLTIFVCSIVLGSGYSGMNRSFSVDGQLKSIESLYAFNTLMSFFFFCCCNSCLYTERGCYIYKGIFIISSTAAHLTILSLLGSRHKFDDEKTQFYGYLVLSFLLLPAIVFTPLEKKSRR